MSASDDDAQLSLPMQIDDDQALLTIADARKNSRSDILGRYSLKIVSEQSDRLDAILRALAEGMPLRQIARAYRVGYYTLTRLRSEFPDKLATHKNRLADDLLTFGQLAIERMIEDIDRMDIDKIGVQLGIALDKHLVLSGSPSVIIGRTEVSHDDVERMRDALIAEVIEIPAETGCGGGSAGQTGEAGAGGLGAVEPVPGSGADEVGK